MISLILASDVKEPTLIVLPPALVSQWMAEFVKICGTALTVKFFPATGRELNVSSNVVITTYPALDHTQHTVAARLLREQRWGRVVLDEMQEIRSSATAIAMNCEGLLSERRWMMSGTPIFDGIADLRGELCFLRVEPFSSNTDDGFFDFAIQNHWEAKSGHGLDVLKNFRLFLLRRSKSMTIHESGLPLLGLKPLTVTFEPVPQSPSERALYCFLEFLVHSALRHDSGDETKSKLFLRLLRQLCVSATLVSGGMGCPSQLETLNRLMAAHNRRLYLTDEPDHDPSLPYSCDEAIRFLSHVVDRARVAEGYVTSLQMGGGGGVSRRDRASESIEEQLSEARDRLTSAQQNLLEARSKRAKANWHRLLELITMGYGQQGVVPTSRIVRLWKWRYLVNQLAITSQGLPVLLLRGWRPTELFFETPSASRAKRNWSRVLDKITRGEAFCVREKESDMENVLNDPGDELKPHDNAGLSPLRRKIRARWRWRFLLNKVLSSPEYAKNFAFQISTKRVDRLLSLKRLSNSVPQCRWAHPFSLLLSNLPRAVSKENLHGSIIDCLLEMEQLEIKQNRHPGSILNYVPISPNDHGSVTVHSISRVEDASSSWKALVQFSRHKYLELFRKGVNRSKGAQLASSGPLPFIEKTIAEAHAGLREAEAENKVYPCDANRKKEATTKKVYERAQRGLCIYGSRNKNKQEGHVNCCDAFGQIRDINPLYAYSLIASKESHIANATRIIAESLGSQHREAEQVKRLTQAQVSNRVSAEVLSLSTFEALQALKDGEADKTQCQVCREPLGNGFDSNGKVSLTRCGHLFCAGCWKEHVRVKTAEGRLRTPCPACRKEVVSDQILTVDPARTADKEALEEKRAKARMLVQEASSMLEESNGRLEPHLWEALYLAIALPPHRVDQSAHSSFTAIPGHVLAHIRHATGNSLYGATSAENNFHLSTKIEALLADLKKLPSGERSVVFASSKLTVKHLSMVLELHRIGYRSLFTGQEEDQSKSAVGDWQNDDLNVPVLVVQAGAAACGLTLVTASKMFLLEPFLKYEEEQQAYGRLHRYGQVREVECKVYFTPVSVESRLLEWRKQGSTTEMEKSIVYAPLRSEVDPEPKEKEDLTQTRFLLGLGDDDASMEEDEEDEDSLIEEEKPSIAYDM